MNIDCMPCLTCLLRRSEWDRFGTVHHRDIPILICSHQFCRHILETQDAPNTDASGHIIGFASFVDLLSQEELGSLVEAIVRKLPEVCGVVVRVQTQSNRNTANAGV